MSMAKDSVWPIDTHYLDLVLVFYSFKFNRNRIGSEV